MSWRNTIKVQNFNFLRNAQEQLESQLERLETEALASGPAQSEWFNSSTFEEEKRRLIDDFNKKGKTSTPTPTPKSFVFLHWE